MKGWVLSAALFAAAGGVGRSLPPSKLPPFRRPPEAAYVAQDSGAALSGLRRFGGDLAFIQLLQYFATPDPGAAGKTKSQWLMDFLPLSRRFLLLSPYFHGGALYSAGCLGFVLDRPTEALSLLDEASSLDPTFWRYRIYAAAIAYREDADPGRVVGQLEEALKYPDCPSMLKYILANLYKKHGGYARAAEIYRGILAVSQDPEAVHRAQEQLEDLIGRGLVR